jgi:hypothetical protein
VASAFLVLLAAVGVLLLASLILVWVAWWLDDS